MAENYQTEQQVDTEMVSTYPGTPRWVKVFLITVIVLVLLVTAVLITGLGGEHGPGRHGSSSDASDDSWLPDFLEQIRDQHGGRH